MRKVFNSRDKVSTYFKGDSENLLKFASHWVDSETGEQIKLSSGFKDYYRYRLAGYRYNVKMGTPYTESHQRVADMLGISFETIKKNYQPLLARMGLIHTMDASEKGKAYYIVDDPQLSKGEWINPKLKKYLDKREYEKPENYESTFEYKNLMILEHNKRLAHSIKRNSESKLYTITQDEYRRLKALEVGTNKKESE